MLVTGDNFVILFLGWEGVGLCSYLLISFWYTRIQANKAAIKALIVNRVADFALTLGLVAIFCSFKTLDFHIVFPLAPFFVNSTFVFLNYNLPVLTVICSLLFIGAMGKSAQIGLHTWLPDAMEGPTPVSALIHAATMVTAGVFLIIKCSPIFEYVPTVLSVITFVGATTAFFSATIGLVQNDIKKVIAYSTCSQLGYMIFACGLSNYHVSLFHLANHAFFKALLFLSAGAIIHSLSNEQDMRRFGGLALLLPYTSIMLLIGSLSLMGFPFLTGFYSKDLILELALTKYTVEGSFAYCLGLVTAFFTSVYSFRVFYMTFIYKNNSFRSVITHVHELPWKMAFSLGVLSFGSIFLGYVAKDLFVGLGTDFWSHSILILPEHNNQLEAEFFGLPISSSFELQSFWNTTYSQRWIKLLPFFSSLIAIVIVFVFFSYGFAKVQQRRQSGEYAYFRKRLPYLFNTKAQQPAPHILRQLFDGKFSLQWLKQIYFSDAVTHAINEYYMSRISDPNPFKFVRFDKKGHPVDDSSKKYTEFLSPADSPLTPLFAASKDTENLYYHQIIFVTYDGYRISEKKPDVNVPKNYSYYIRETYSFLIYKWYFDAVYNELLNRPLVKMAYTTIFCSLDKGVLELFGPYGLSLTLLFGANQIQRMQRGEVYYYAYFMMMFLLVSLGLFTHGFNLPSFF
jgi:proton-translocating NADH-quinone oxidoreductase chain L